MTGLQAYKKKEKRAMRRRNHIARDLEEKKYRQRIINPKRAGKYPDVNDWLIGDDDDYERDSNRGPEQGS